MVFLLLCILTTDALAYKPEYGGGIQWSLLSSFLPCIAFRSWQTTKLGFQGMLTALAAEEEEGTFYFGGRLLYRGHRKIPVGVRLNPYGGIGLGYRQDKFTNESKQGFGVEIFTGLELYLEDFIAVNGDFGVRYLPASLSGFPYVIGVGGGVIWYF